MTARVHASSLIRCRSSTFSGVAGEDYNPLELPSSSPQRREDTSVILNRSADRYLMRRLRPTERRKDDADIALRLHEYVLDEMVCAASDVRQWERMISREQSARDYQLIRYDYTGDE